MREIIADRGTTGTGPIGITNWSPIYAIAGPTGTTGSTGVRGITGTGPGLTGPPRYNVQYQSSATQQSTNRN